MSWIHKQGRYIWGPCFNLHCRYSIFDNFQHLCIRRLRQTNWTSDTYYQTQWVSSRSCKPVCLHIIPLENQFKTNTSSEIELYRLEQRYARRKHRTSFHDVQYVDGEYVFNSSLNSPTSSVSKHSTGGHGKSSTWSASNESRWRWWLLSVPSLNACVDSV